MSETINRKGSYYYTENDMINDPYIRSGLIVHTLGKNAINDSSGALYAIVKYTNAVVVNQMEGIEFYQVRTSEHLFAEKIQMNYQIMDDDVMSDKELTIAFKQFKNEVEGSFSQLSTSTRESLTALTNSVNRLTDELSALVIDTTNKFASVNNAINRVSNTASELDTKIDQTAASIRNEISTVSTNLNNKIDQTASSIRNEISSTSNSLTNMINNISNNIDARITYDESIANDSNAVMLEYMANNEIINFIDVTGDGCVKIKGDINGNKYIIVSDIIVSTKYVNEITLTDSNMWIIPIQIKISDGRVTVVENSNFKMELLTANDDTVLKLTLKQPAIDNVVTDYK